MTSDQTFKLRVETKLMVVIVHRNYVILLPALDNHIFSLCGPYLVSYYKA